VCSFTLPPLVLGLRAGDNGFTMVPRTACQNRRSCYVIGHAGWYGSVFKTAPDAACGAVFGLLSMAGRANPCERGTGSGGAEQRHPAGVLSWWTGRDSAADIRGRQKRPLEWRANVLPGVVVWPEGQLFMAWPLVYLFGITTSEWSMVKKSLPSILGVLFVLLSPCLAKADFLFISTPSDPNHLHVGQAAVFSVNLQGVDPSDSSTFLSFLAATVSFDSTLLTQGAVISPGSIIPDKSGFVGTPFPDAADGLYDGVFIASTPVSDSGLFFSFALTPSHEGSGSFDFSALAATLASDPNQNDQFTPDSLGLNFVIEGSVATSVPAPASFILLVLGGLTLLATQKSRLALRGL
jgi:hypothetical protein